MSHIVHYFQRMHALSASDLHLTAGFPPAVRIHGEIVDIEGERPLEDRALQALLRELVNDAQWTSFVAKRDLDFACGFAGLGRFRANYFVQHGGAAAVFRRIPESVIPLEQLGLPPVAERIADLSSKLVLVTGPTGSGKSTTLAAIIDRINRRRSRHIVTVEDPVEFIHENHKSIVTQREIGTDTLSFAAGLASAVRADADVVLVGEMRDQETIETGLRAASMGVLVFGTLHTNGAAKTIDRVVDVFPAGQRAEARDALAGCLAAVISQILLRRAEGTGRVAAHEILVATTAVSAAIRDGNTAMLGSIIGSGKRLGMCTMDDAIKALLDAGRISREEAHAKAHDKGRFTAPG